MIVLQLPGKLRVTYQTDHAALSGQFTANWGNTDFQHPAPLPAVQIASTHHDDGWYSWEAAPKVDSATGRPLDFLHSDIREHTAFYRAGIAQVTNRDLYAGLLVNMHGCGIYNGRYGVIKGPGLERYSEEDRPVVEAFIAEHEAEQQALRKQLGGGNSVPYAPSPGQFERQLWANYRLLQIWDFLSLYLCMNDLASAAPRTIGPLPHGYNEDRETELLLTPQSATIVAIAPYPFTQSPLPLMLVVRDIPDRTYTSDRDLQETLGVAGKRVLTFQAVRE